MWSIGSRHEREWLVPSVSSLCHWHGAAVSHSLLRRRWFHWDAIFTSVNKNCSNLQWKLQSTLCQLQYFVEKENLTVYLAYHCNIARTTLHWHPHCTLTPVRAAGWRHGNLYQHRKRCRHVSSPKHVKLDQNGFHTTTSEATRGH